MFQIRDLPSGVVCIIRFVPNFTYSPPDFPFGVWSVHETTPTRELSEGKWPLAVAFMLETTVREIGIIVRFE